jgi:hypothetical protein
MAAIDAIVVVVKVAAIAKIEAVGKNFMGLIELLYGSVRDTASTLDRIHCRSTFNQWAKLCKAKAGQQHGILA